MKNVAILLNLKDNVATALAELEPGQTVNVTLDDLTHTTILREKIEFGHKYALRSIAKGEEILKHGLPIGQALEEIEAGAWVHVHNCRSKRFGFHRKQYGLHA